MNIQKALKSKNFRQNALKAIYRNGANKVHAATMQANFQGATMSYKAGNGQWITRGA